VREQGVALEHRADGPRFRRAVREVDAVEEDAAAIREIETGDHSQECRLPATRRAEQGEKFAGLDRQAHAVDRGEVAEAARHVSYFEERHRTSCRHGLNCGGL